MWVWDMDGWMDDECGAAAMAADKTKTFFAHDFLFADDDDEIAVAVADCLFAFVYSRNILKI